MSPDEWVALGIVGRAHGLAGAVLFHPYNQAGEAVGVGTCVKLTLADGAVRKLVFAEITQSPKGWIVRFEDGAGFVNSRTAAEGLNHARVELQRKDFPPLEEGEFYHVDLVGIPVYDAHEKHIGSVSRVEPWPTVDSLVVDQFGQGTIEVPIVPALVLELDVPGRKIVVDLDALEGG